MPVVIRTYHSHLFNIEKILSEELSKVFRIGLDCLREGHKFNNFSGIKVSVV